MSTQQVIEHNIQMAPSNRKSGEIRDVHGTAGDDTLTTGGSGSLIPETMSSSPLTPEAEENGVRRIDSVITCQDDDDDPYLFRTPDVSLRKTTHESLQKTPSIISSSSNRKIANDEYTSAPMSLHQQERRSRSLDTAALPRRSIDDPSRRHSADDDLPLVELPSRAFLRQDETHAEMKSVMVTGTRRNSRTKRILNEFTINKLNLKELGLVGREQEKKVLEFCMQRLLRTTNADFMSDDSDELLLQEDGKEEPEYIQNELIFIKGYSGIGKSVLARTLEKDIGPSGIYVEGKYEFTSTDEPYSGVAQAFGRLCDEFEYCDEETLENISKAIAENMKEEAHMLMSLIPEIIVFLGNDTSVDTSLQGTIPSAGREHERWKYAFRTFTRILGSYFAPIVMVLDDVQWADISSLDILDYLVSDVQNPYPLMIVGCYRSNEVDENSILYNRIQSLQGKSKKGIFQLTEIELQNCNMDSVNKILMAMLSVDDESFTRDLAKICFKRTLGNPFFLIEFMRMLHAENFVEFNLGILKWVWDAKAIESATMSTDNAVDLLKGRIRKLSKDVQLLLQYAACLGSSFHVHTLEFVWKEHGIKESGGETQDVAFMVNIVQDAQMVERCGSDELRWVHDKVQEAALSLSDLVTPQFEFGLGMCLYNGLTSNQIENLIYDVADLVNKGDRTGRIDVAVLNLRAAQKARKMAALQSAAKYAEFGINQLPPEDKWTLHRDLTLKLYSLGAEMEYALGNISRAEEYIKIMLDRDEFTPMETLSLRKMKAQILATAHLKWSEACDYGLVILKDLGSKYKWNKGLVALKMLLAIRKMAKRVEKLAVQDVRSMNFIQNKRHLAEIDILKLMKHLAYSANDLPLCFLCVCKVIEMTLDYGISLCSADCFATFGGVLMFLYKDHAAASHVCDLAFALQTRSGRRYIADTMHGSWAFVLVHMKPFHEGMHQTMEGYTQGLRDGDPLDSTNCLINRFVLLPYMMGRTLHSIIKEFPKIAPQLEESGILNNILTLKVWWQMMLNLRLPPGKESKQLEGKKFRQSEEQAESNMHVGNLNLAIGELLLYFGDHETRAKRLLREEKGKTYSELVQGYPPHGIETFHRGITWFAMARKTGKRRYRSQAQKVMKEIAKWAKNGNPNVVDYDLLLHAEDAILNKKYEIADSLYKRAIIHACRIGHLAHAALYNERFAEYRFEVHKDVDDAKYHMGEAIRYYTEWGAIGKAEQLRNKVLEF